MAEGRVQIEVNGVEAFVSNQPHLSVVVPTFEPGFHRIQAFVTDDNGQRIGAQSERVQFLYDPQHLQHRCSAQRTTSPFVCVCVCVCVCACVCVCVYVCVLCMCLLYKKSRMPVDSTHKHATKGAGKPAEFQITRTHLHGCCEPTDMEQ